MNTDNQNDWLLEIIIGLATLAIILFLPIIVMAAAIFMAKCYPWPSSSRNLQMIPQNQQSCPSTPKTSLPEKT